MADVAANVRIGVTGGVFNGPTTTPLPATPTVALNAAFLARELGYLSEAGVTQSIASSVTTIKAWQNSDTVRKVQTEHDVTYALEFEETSPLTWETYYGNYTAIDSSSGVSTITGALMPLQAWVIDVIDGLAHIRLVLPSAQITDRGDTVMSNAGALVYPITLTAFPDNSGVKAYKYMDRDITVSA